jgi:hypothetical protein
MMQTYYQTLSKVRFRFVAGKVRANFFRCHSDKNAAAYGIFSVSIKLSVEKKSVRFGEKSGKTKLK